MLVRAGDWGWSMLGKVEKWNNATRLENCSGTKGGGERMNNKRRDDEKLENAQKNLKNIIFFSFRESSVKFINI